MPCPNVTAIQELPIPNHKCMVDSCNNKWTAFEDKFWTKKTQAMLLYVLTKLCNGTIAWYLICNQHLSLKVPDIMLDQIDIKFNQTDATHILDCIWMTFCAFWWNENFHYNAGELFNLEVTPNPIHFHTQHSFSK